MVLLTHSAHVCTMVHRSNEVSMAKRKAVKRVKIRHVVYLDPKMSKELLALRDKTGALPTEIVRRALGEYLKRAK